MREGFDFEPALQAEMDAHLQSAERGNRRNGSGRKTVKSTAGSFELATPRDRADRLNRNWRSNTNPI